MHPLSHVDATKRTHLQFVFDDLRALLNKPNGAVKESDRQESK